MNGLIEALDQGLAEAGEDFILRRVIGIGQNAANVDVTCRARINVIGAPEIVGSDKMAAYEAIFSPTQINAAQWPGGSIPKLPPYDVDQRIPRKNGADKAIIRGTLCTVADSKPIVIGGELVRIEIKAVG